MKDSPFTIIYIEVRAAGRAVNFYVESAKVAISAPVEFNTKINVLFMVTVVSSVV